MEEMSVYIEDEIVFGIYNSEYITFDVAMKGFQKRLSLSNGKSYPLLVDLTLAKSYDKETKDFFSSKDSSQYTTAGALLVTSVFNKPPIASRIFTDKKEALSQYKTS